MDLDSFWRALGGGAPIGLAAALLLWANGRVVGVSGMLSGVIAPVRGDVLWRVLALLGLLSAGAVALWLAPEQVGRSPRPLVLLALAGLLVGAGTQLGKGSVYALAYRLVLRRPRPLLAEAFVLPARGEIDAKLLGGAALFGIGWGMSGYCPGPWLAARLERSQRIA